MERFLQSMVLFLVILNVLSEPPMYSVNYAKIRYQPRQNWESHKAELNLDERHREEVTEKSLPTKSLETNNDDSHFESFDITTERESEQINVARFIYRNIVKDKLVRINKNGATDEDVNTAAALQEKSTRENKINSVTEYDKPVNKEEENLVTANTETLGHLDNSEVSNLNEDGVYYIYHPDMLLQKVVYRIQDDPDNMEFSTQVNYENVAPIVEHIFTYDPRTFVLQRLILRPQEQT